jgi:hypothetical protein
MLHFQKRGFAGKDSLVVYVENLTATTYKNLQVMVEIVSGKPGAIDDILLHYPIKIETLEGNASSPFIILSSDTLLPLSGHLLTGILNYDGAHNPLAGDYDNLSMLFEKRDTVIKTEFTTLTIYDTIVTDTSVIIDTVTKIDTTVLITHKIKLTGHGSVHGFVLENGQSIFRVAKPGVAAGNYYIKGVFTDSLYFDGAMQNLADNTISVIELDTLSANYHFMYDKDTKKMTFRLKIAPPFADSSNRMLFSLQKN